jgi:ABC-type nitrate/sulfonate/bicarbonate transport system ATPase subunit
MIELQQVDFIYPGQTTPLFYQFNWRVERGQFWAVIGPSGCGKSSLLHLIVGARAASRGTITVNGEAVPRKKNRGKTGLVLQDYGMLPWATVRENVELGLRIRKFYRQDNSVIAKSRKAAEKQSPGYKESASLPTVARSDTSRVDFWLDRFGLGGLRNKYPAQISGGQRQRAAIARTLVLEPDVLLMDEPFSALDAPTREDLEQLTLNLQAETKTTTVFVTHNIEEAVFLGQQILVLSAPPHSSPVQIVENPDAGLAEYRDTPAFAQKAHQLREILKSNAQT